MLPINACDKEKHCPVFIRFVNNNTEQPPEQLKPFLRKLLEGGALPNKLLELRGQSETGKELFEKVLMGLVSKEQSKRVFVDDLKGALPEAFKAFKLIIIHESIFDLTKRQLNILRPVVTSPEIHCLFIKTADMDTPLKLLPDDLATPLIFKRTPGGYAALNYVLANELDGIKKWVLG